MTPETVLVIDDDPVFSIIAEELLMAIGVTSVSCAKNGRIGIDMVAAAPHGFDLIICDLQMPTLDGVSVMSKLGQTGYSGAVIIVSSEGADVLQTVFRMGRAQKAGNRCRNRSQQIWHRVRYV